MKNKSVKSDQTGFTMMFFLPLISLEIGLKVRITLYTFLFDIVTATQMILKENMN